MTANVTYLSGQSAVYLADGAPGADEWDCRRCADAFFGTAPDDGLCRSCRGAVDGQPGTLTELAEIVAGHLREHFDPATLAVQQVLCLAEESGEFTAAYRRHAGMARRRGTWDDVRAELADVVITAYVTARVLGIDLDAAWREKAEAVLARGWREPPPAA
jgi:NTP pyrophosphatase (non-canonical NTP hydrolase)